MLDESPINGPVSPNAHLGIPSPDWRKVSTQHSTAFLAVLQPVKNL